MRRTETTHLASDLLRIRREIPLLKTHDSLSDLEGALITLKRYCHRSALAEALIEPLATLTRRPPELWVSTLDSAINRLMTEGEGCAPASGFILICGDYGSTSKTGCQLGFEKGKNCRVDLSVKDSRPRVIG